MRFEPVNIPEADETVICGTCSGIPDCCISFYNDWIGIATVLLRLGHDECYNRFLWLVYYRGFRYVPCPDCLKKAEPITLTRCEDVQCPIGRVF